MQFKYYTLVVLNWSRLRTQHVYLYVNVLNIAVINAAIMYVKNIEPTLISMK